MFLQSSRFSRPPRLAANPGIHRETTGVSGPGPDPARQLRAPELDKAGAEQDGEDAAFGAVQVSQAVQSLVVRGRRAADSRPGRICGPFAPALRAALAVPELGRDCAVESEEVLCGAWVGVGRVRLPRIRLAIAPLDPPGGQRYCSGRDGCPLLWLPSWRVDRTPPQSASPARRCRRRSSGRGRR